jgi:hypothetical protein
MLEELEGRLKWERTISGVLVSIPARRGALTVLYGPVVGIWLVAAAFRYWHVLEGTHAEDTEFTLQVIAIMVYALGFVFAIFWLLWTFTNETVVLLDQAELQIQRRVMGIELSRRSFQTSDARNLRFIPPTESWASQGHTDMKTSRIEFQTFNKKHVFAEGITEREAHALFALMNGIYKFPNYLETPKGTVL